MRNLLFLAVLSLITASSAGCFHRNQCCGGGGSGGLFSWRQQPQAQVMQYSDPCCGQQAVPCCPPP
ncbi:MAG: hypothetical protein WD845_02575, partial [Pirellulales bacterium]